MKGVNLSGLVVLFFPATLKWVFYVLNSTFTPFLHRQESFFLSETCKYLYLLFDTENPINKNGEQYIFTTEGHVFPVREQLRSKIWDMDYDIVSIPPQGRLKFMTFQD